jgi:hypothetical protein
MNKRLVQVGAPTEPILAFLEVLLDLKHQETFKGTIANRYQNEPIQTNKEA